MNVVTNVVDSVVSTVNNVVDSVQDVVSTVQLVGDILWDNALSPAWDVFLNSNFT